MSRVIRIDDEVWAWLQSKAEPLEDTPNTVLRRLANLDRSDPAVEGKRPEGTLMNSRTLVVSRKGERTGSGKQLNVQWRVGAQHALYHKEGNYYNHLIRFPGALFDPNGYVLFKTKSEYESSPYLQHGQQLHVPDLLSSMPNYARMT